MSEQSPIETLASFALAFAAGAVLAVVIAAYGTWMRRQGRISGQVQFPL